MPSSKPRAPRPRNRVATGRHFEQLAADFFSAQGFSVLDRNFRSGSREIDLIVRRDNLIIFVEVKASHSESFGHPAERVDRRKQAFLAEAARRYTVDRNITACDLRFDIVTFVRGKLEHYPNAFLLDE